MPVLLVLDGIEQTQNYRGYASCCSGLEVGGRGKTDRQAQEQLAGSCKKALAADRPAAAGMPAAAGTQVAAGMPVAADRPGVAGRPAVADRPAGSDCRPAEPAHCCQGCQYECQQDPLP